MKTLLNTHTLDGYHVEILPEGKDWVTLADHFSSRTAASDYALNLVGSGVPWPSVRVIYIAPSKARIVEPVFFL